LLATWLAAKYPPRRAGGWHPTFTLGARSSARKIYPLAAGAAASEHSIYDQSRSHRARIDGARLDRTQPRATMVIPYSHGEALFAAGAREPKDVFLELSGGQ